MLHRRVTNAVIIKLSYASIYIFIYLILILQVERIKTSSPLYIHKMELISDLSSFYWIFAENKPGDLSFMPSIRLLSNDQR